MDKKQERLKKLTPTQFAVTQEAATECPFTGRYDDFMMRGSTSTLCLANHFFHPGISTMQVVAGHPSLNRLAN